MPHYSGFPARKWKGYLLLAMYLGFDFTITYHKGIEHDNADALSRQCTNHHAAVGHIFPNIEELKPSATPNQDPVICYLHDTLLYSHVTPTGHKWSHPPLCQLWSQLLLKDGQVCQ